MPHRYSEPMKLDTMSVSTSRGPRVRLHRLSRPDMADGSKDVWLEVAALSMPDARALADALIDAVKLAEFTEGSA